MRLTSTDGDACRLTSGEGRCGWWSRVADYRRKTEDGRRRAEVGRGRGIPASSFALRATADRGKAGTTNGDLVCSAAFRRRWLRAGIDRIIGDRKNPPSLLAMVDKTDRL